MPDINRHADLELASSESDEQAYDEMQECIEECLNCHAVCKLALA